MISIKNAADCCGCYSCYNSCPIGCIAMKEDQEGFIYPIIDISKCVNCNSCINSCPIINSNRLSDDKNTDKISFAAYSNNDSLLKSSSSGGIFSVLSMKIMSEGGVVFGASFDDSFSVVHKAVEDVSMLPTIQGSKYVQSSLITTYKDVKTRLKSGQKVLFSGTPCQVAALKCYLNKSYENLITIDVVCHGVPSNTLWKKYLNEKSRGIVRSVSFRDKKTGWKSYSLTIHSKKWFSVIHNYSSYMRAYIYGLSMRPSCYKCKYKGDNHCSEITLGDFWGIQNVVPRLCDVDGVTWIILNNAKGKELFDSIKDDSLDFYPVITQEANKYNPSYSSSTPIPKERQEFFERINVESFDKVVNKDLCKISLKSRIIYSIKNAIRNVQHNR